MIIIGSEKDKKNVKWIGKEKPKIKRRPQNRVKDISNADLCELLLKLNAIVLGKRNSAVTVSRIRAIARHPLLRRDGTTARGDKRKIACDLRTMGYRKSSDEGVGAEINAFMIVRRYLGLNGRSSSAKTQLKIEGEVLARVHKRRYWTVRILIEAGVRSLSDLIDFVEQHLGT